jgi:hypothetical protein
MMRPISLGVLAFVLANGSATGATSRSIRLDIANETDTAILEVYVTPSKSPGWGSNLLREGPLERSRRTTLSFQGACGLYDVRLVAPGGREYMDDEVSLCGEQDVLTVGAVEIKKTRRSEPK